MDQRGLFGDFAAKVLGRKDAGPFRKASSIWALLYAARYGQAYEWRGRCNRHIADILAALGGSTDLFKLAAGEYLADRWRGYDGHELRYLARDITKFRARANKRFRPGDRSGDGGGGNIRAGGIGGDAARRSAGKRSDAIL